MGLGKDKRILVVDDDDSGREAMELLLAANGFAVTATADAASALKIFEKTPFPLVLSDLMLPDKSGIELLKLLKGISDATEVIMVTGHASAESAVLAMKEGAFDYITKPLNFDELKLLLDKASEKLRLVSENIYLRNQLASRFEFSSIIGVSPKMHSLFERMRRIVKTDSTVLITGESGTGKELVARALHQNGSRKDKPFVAVNCGAIPESLLESELFGHERGSFTGAVKDRTGKFEAANNGTIFLDEIGTMPLLLQSKLLRVLQEQEIERVGSTRSIKIDVRIISATNSNLLEMVRLGQFREDLYYRLNVIPLQLPPLRERKEDILLLADRFLEKSGKLMGRGELAIQPEVKKALENYQWPGNVRELENMMERLVALSDGASITVDDLPQYIIDATPSKNARVTVTKNGVDMPAIIEELEKDMIVQALELAGGVKTKAATYLGINRTTLGEKIKRLFAS